MDIGMAVLIGVLGGLLGATWNGLNTRLTRLRLRWITTSNRKVFIRGLVIYPKYD